MDCFKNNCQSLPPITVGPYEGENPCCNTDAVRRVDTLPDPADALGNVVYAIGDRVYVANSTRTGYLQLYPEVSLMAALSFLPSSDGLSSDLKLNFNQLLNDTFTYSLSYTTADTITGKLSNDSDVINGGSALVLLTDPQLPKTEPYVTVAIINKDGVEVFKSIYQNPNYTIATLIHFDTELKKKADSKDVIGLVDLKVDTITFDNTVTGINTRIDALGSKGG